MPLLPRGRTRTLALTCAQLLQGSPPDRKAQLRPNRNGHPEITTENDRNCRNPFLNGPITVRSFIPPSDVSGF